jgi:hypothetical protein
MGRMITSLVLIESIRTDRHLFDDRENRCATAGGNRIRAAHLRLRAVYRRDPEQ